MGVQTLPTKSVFQRVASRVALQFGGNNLPKHRRMENVRPGEWRMWCKMQDVFPEEIEKQFYHHYWHLLAWYLLRYYLVSLSRLRRKTLADEVGRSQTICLKELLP